jgi:hypothetical protein
METGLEDWFSEINEDGKKQGALEGVLTKSTDSETGSEKFFWLLCASLTVSSRYYTTDEETFMSSGGFKEAFTSTSNQMRSRIRRIMRHIVFTDILWTFEA